LGGQALSLPAAQTQVGRGEPIEDTARTLSGYVHCIVHRTFGHERVENMALASRVPVINGLSDQFHPCQLLADLLTIRTSFGRLEGVRVAYVGDGNNMAHSYLLAAGRAGLDLAI